MPRKTLPLLAAAALLLTACHDDPDPSGAPPPAEFTAQVRTTRYGVPHVQATDFASLGYGVGDSQLHVKLDATTTLWCDNTAGKEAPGFQTASTQLHVPSVQLAVAGQL